MALDVLGRALVWAHAMRQPAMGDWGGLTKVELRATVDAIDTWIEAAQGNLPPLVGFNAALPPVAQNALSGQQKAVLFSMVLMRRVGLLPTEGG